MNIYHYGKEVRAGAFLIQLSKRSTPVEVSFTENERITTIYQALAYILQGKHNLMRVLRYKGMDDKFHRFTFHSIVSMGNPRSYCLDSEKEVIQLAKVLRAEKALGQHTISLLYIAAKNNRPYLAKTFLCQNMFYKMCWDDAEDIVNFISSK